MACVAGGQAARLLIIGGESPERERLGRWLRDEGLPCAIAGGPAAARACLLGGEFDLILAEIRTLGNDSSHICGLIEEASPTATVLGIADAGVPPEAVRAAVKQAYGLLRYPFDRAEALALVRLGLWQRRICMRMNRIMRRSWGDDGLREQAIRRLTRVATLRDEETGGHVRRSGVLCGLLAHAAGWEARRAGLMRVAAPLHDIGKLAIPGPILFKPGRLDPPEVFAMQAHTLLGFRMLAGTADPALRMAQEIALGHHERWDGRGYPSGLVGPAIPESARLVAVVDVFDALTHDRPYRKAIRWPQALEIMREGRGTHFDPRLLDLFLARIPDWSPATCVGHAWPN